MTVDKYSWHLTVEEIKKNIEHFNPFSFQRVSNSNFSKLLENVKAAMLVIYFYLNL